MFLHPPAKKKLFATGNLSLETKMCRYPSVHSSPGLFTPQNRKKATRPYRDLLVADRDVFLALNDSSRALGDNIQDEDFVDDVLETLDEQQSNAQHIMDLINSKPLDASSLTDDDIEEELQSLMTEQPRREVNTTDLPFMPDVPKKTIPKKEGVVDSI